MAARSQTAGLCKAASRRPRLLVVGNGPSGIGDDGSYHVDRTCGQVLLGLAERGFAVTFVQPMEPLGAMLNYYGCVLPPDRIRAIGLDKSRLLATLRGIAAVTQAMLRADFVHLFFPGTLPRRIVPFLRWFRIPYGLYLRGSEFSDEGADARILRDAQVVLAVSEGLANRARRSNARVDVVRPSFELTARDAHVRQFGPLKDRAARLLFVGRIDETKGVPELIAATERLGARGVRVELKLVGFGYLHEALSARFPDEDGQAIRVVGALEDRAQLLRAYQKADIFVLPTHQEGFPRVLYEAMIKSAVVVTTMVGGIPGVMQDEVNCLAVPVDDADAIARAIERLVEDPRLMERLATAGLATVLRIFDGYPTQEQALHARLTAGRGDDGPPPGEEASSG